MMMKSPALRMPAVEHIEQLLLCYALSPAGSQSRRCGEGVYSHLPVDPVARLTPVGGPASQGGCPQVQLEDLSGQAEVGSLVTWSGSVTQAGPAANDEDPPAILRHRQT